MATRQDKFPRKRQQQLLESNRFKICSQLDLSETSLNQFVTFNVINTIDKQIITSKSIQYERNGAFVDIVKNTDFDKYKRCLQVLIESNQIQVSKWMGAVELGLACEDDVEQKSVLDSMTCAVNSQAMKEILGNKALHDVSEWETIKTLLEWIMDKNLEYSSEVEDLLAAVYMEWVNSKQLKSLVTAYEDFQHKDALQQRIHEAMDWQMKTGQFGKMVDKNLFPRPRPGRPILAVIAGLDRRPQHYHSSDLYSMSDGAKVKAVTVPDLSDCRAHAAVVVTGNNAYIIGGWDGITPTVTCTKLDTSTWTMTELASMKHARCRHTACAVDGDIVVVAGFSTEGTTDTVETFSTKQQSWKESSSFPFAINDLASCELDGLLYTSGGILPRKLSDDIHSYKDGVWRFVTKMIEPRAIHAMSAVNGILLIIGGRLSTTAEMFDPRNRQATLISQLPNMTGLMTNAVTCNSQVMVLAPRCRCLLSYDPDTEEWHTSQVQLTRPYKTTHIGVIQVDGESCLLVMAGDDIGEEQVTSDLFTITGDPLSDTLPNLPVGVDDAVAVVLDGKVYLIGGSGEDGITSARCYRTSIGSDRWSDIANLSMPRAHHSAVVIQGKIIAVGGSSAASVYHDTVEMFDPSINKWYHKRKFLPRGHSAVSECDGLLYLSGGATPDGFILSYIHSYDLTSDSWSMVGEMQSCRAWHIMATVGKKLYMVGGAPKNETTECFDPVTSQTTTLAPPPSVSLRFTMPVVHHDNIIILSAEDRQLLVYQPGSNTWIKMDIKLAGPLVGTHLALLYK